MHSTSQGGKHQYLKLYLLYNVSKHSKRNLFQTIFSLWNFKMRQGRLAVNERLTCSRLQAWLWLTSCEGMRPLRPEHSPFSFHHQKYLCPRTGYFFLVSSKHLSWNLTLNVPRAGETAQWARLLASKPNEESSALENPHATRTEAVTQPSCDFHTHTLWHTHMYKYIHSQLLMFLKNHTEAICCNAWWVINNLSFQISV